MERIGSLEEFGDRHDELFMKKGFNNNLIGEYLIVALQNFRVAASFAAGLFGGLIVEDVKLQEVIKEIAEECYSVISDISIYIISDEVETKDLSALKSAVSKARSAVGHAGNFCNNAFYLFPKNIQAAILQARDICDYAVKNSGKYN